MPFLDGASQLLVRQLDRVHLLDRQPEVRVAVVPVRHTHGACWDQQCTDREVHGVAVTMCESQSRAIR